MGGINSGRHWHWGAKSTTTDFHSIDVRRWKRDGLLEPHQFFSWQWSRHGKTLASIGVRTETGRVTLIYSQRKRYEEWTEEKYSVFLDWTECHLGGKRPWFRCPASGCGRRAAILYGGRIFACRRCHQLAYPSQREAAYDRAARQAEKIREQLGWEPGILNIAGNKPKGMHWNTFEQLTAKHDDFVQSSLYQIERKLRLAGESLDDWRFLLES